MLLNADLAGFGSLLGLIPPESFSPLDLHFARLMTRLAKQERTELFFAAALVSKQTREGHICLDLSEMENDDFFRELSGDNVETIPIPSLKAIKSVLSEASVVGSPGEFKPLILDSKNRLYLNRYWQYEERVVEFIKNRVQAMTPIKDVDALQKNLDKYFPLSEDKEIDWQRIAAITSNLKKFCVITGGPGTGKTYTVAKIIALLLEQSDNKDLRIILAAPTGKAAVRLQNSIQNAKGELKCSEDIKKAIPEEASTIHRLLGTIPNSPYFRRNAENPLGADVVIVDEASMIDLALMAKLAEAMPVEARLILLGDSNQLASVEAGAVLGDICDLGETHPYSEGLSGFLESVGGQALELKKSSEPESGIQDCIVRLRKSYRFESQKGIGELSHAVNSGDGDRSLEILKDGQFPDVGWRSLNTGDMMAAIQERFKDYDHRANPQEIFERFGRFRILCAIREGPQGVHTINAKIEQFIKKRLRVRRDEFCYAGQPVLITQNDYNLNLFNGDLGIILPDPEREAQLRAYFPESDGSFRKILPYRLPNYETAYAMTVHKGQGSEFEQVLLLLPGKDSPILTRELIYTGLTRAIKRVEIWGDEAVFRDAVSRRIKRTSGLRDALWGADD